MAKPKQKAKSKTRRVKAKTVYEDNSVYLLKLVIFLILGSQWLYIENLPEWQIPIPIGLIAGLVIASHDHFKIDQKLEYMVLVISAFVSFWLPLGLVIQL